MIHCIIIQSVVLTFPIVAILSVVLGLSWLYHHILSIVSYIYIRKLGMLRLTHLGRMTHICVANLTIIRSDNGLSPGRRQTIIWTNAGMKLHLRVSAKRRLICLGLNELILWNTVPCMMCKYLGTLWPELCNTLCLRYVISLSSICRPVLKYRTYQILVKYIFCVHLILNAFSISFMKYVGLVVRF